MSPTSRVQQLVDLFQFTRILKSDPRTKTVTILGQINGKDAIISLEKTHFLSENDGQYDVHHIVQQLKLIQNNDIYFWAKAMVKQSVNEFPGAKLNLIFPATPTHIKKFGVQKYHYVKETPEIYHKYVAPYIESKKGDRLKWVYNILFEGKESETFVYHDKDPDTGFVLLPDMKWDAMNLDTLYLCCIVNRMDILSIRDLNGSHLEFLESMITTLRDVTNHKFGIAKDELRIFVHYQPSYYHFHVHVVITKHAGLGDGIIVGKAILLDDVIENIRLVPDYYQKRTLGYVIGDNHGLWEIEGYRENSVPQ